MIFVMPNKTVGGTVMRLPAMKVLGLAGLFVCIGALPAAARGVQPWMNQALNPDQRASLVIKKMTRTEMLSLVRGWMGLPCRPNTPAPIPCIKKFHDVIGSAGYVPGIARLGIPPLQETDAGLGVSNMMGMMRPGDVATALPSGLSTAASFDPQMAYRGGAMIANEAWRKGFNVLLGPGADLIRDPRGGRAFEYFSEDPLLTGRLAAAAIQGIQSRHVVAVIKHYAMNDQETNRSWANAIISDSAMRESDLLGFELAIEGGHPGAVMCSYNLVNGAYACGNHHLLDDILKGDWQFPGWVMSDWGAVHNVNFAMAGLDQESAAVVDAEPYFGAPLKAALKNGTIPKARLVDMVHRILRSMFAVGVVDHPPVKSTIDYRADGDVALTVAKNGIVLLKNKAHLLPLNQKIERIAVIGGHADVGVLSGGGSSQVYPVGKPGTVVPIGGGGNPMMAALNTMVFDPSSPLAAMRKQSAKTEIRFDPGNYPSAAARLAKWADVVVVFATQWSSEGQDLPDLSLPNGQDALIDAVAAANPKTIVVLETGSAVTMPWLDKVGAVVEAWYPGQRGGDAIADILYGKVDPSGHLPITFPQNVRQLPQPAIAGLDVQEPEQGPGEAKQQGTVFDVDYSEGADVGYRWFAQKGIKPLFPFGYGLSYTTFNYSHLDIQGGKTLTVSFDVTNTGETAGRAVPQVYLTSRDGQALQRLIGFSSVSLDPQQTQHVTVSVDPRLLADFDAGAHDWRVPAGAYAVMVGRAATEPVLSGSATLDGEVLEP